MSIIYKITRITLVMLFACGMLNAQEVVADYSFSGNAADETSFGNDAAINGALLTQDRFGAARSAFHFDGVTAFLGAPNAAHLLTDNVTISMWVNVTELPPQGEAYLLSFGGWQERYKISLPGHGKVIWTTNADGISDMDAGDGNELQEGVWTHVAVVHNGAQDKIFINGALVASKDVTGPLNATDAPLGIGYNIYEGGSYFSGAIDDVLIFDDAVSDQDIADLYAQQSTAPVFPNGIVANYGFGGSYQDSSAFGIQAKGNGSRLTTDRFGFGNSAVLCGGEASVDIPNSNHLNSPATSIAFWVNLAELPGSGEVYLASHGGWQERWKVSLPSHGKPVFTTNHENGISDMDSGDGNELVPGEWTHCTFVHDGATDKIYINGALVAEKEVVGDLNSTQYDFALGFNPIDMGNYANAQFDELRVYNFALTDQDISDLYALQSTPNVEDDPLVANYGFAGTGEDASQFGNDAIVMGAVPGVDRFGYAGNAMDFSGMNVAYAMNSTQYQSESTTIAFWVNVKELPGSGEVFILSHGGWQERWKISLPSHGKPVFTTNHENGISDMDSGDGNELVEGTWTHVAMVHDGAKDIIYMDGARVAEKDVVGGLNKTAYPFGMGFDPIGGENFFEGMLDEVRLYNVALTDQEIADLYAAQNEDPAYADELVANYPFSGNALDETPFNNHGWVNGAVLGNDRFGRVGQAFRFDGTSANIVAGNSKQLQSPQASISYWVNVRELPGSGEVFLLSHGGWQQRWKISLPSHGKPVFTTNHTNGISDMDSGDGNELVPGEWTHVVMVHDGAKNIIYFDGAQVAEKDVVGDLNETEYDLGIGFNPIDVANYFNGMLDEVQIYNVALTAQEVADLYAAQSEEPDETDTEAPTAPVDLRADINNTDVRLSWCESTDNVALGGYMVFQDSVMIAQTHATHFDVPGLAQLTTYEFGVAAFDLAGNASLTTRVQVTTGVDSTPDTIPPTPPSNLMASVSSNSIVVSWDASTDNQAVAGYIVYNDGFLVDSTAANVLSLFISGLEPETPYYIEVQAFDLSGNLSEFAELEVTTDPPVDAGEEGLVAHYPMEGNADDATPYENHGTPGGDVAFEMVTDRPDASGMAAVFDGDRDSVLVPNAPQLISEYTTVSFWIRVDGQNLEDPEAYVLDFGHWDQRWKISLPQHLKIVWTTNSETVQFPNSVSDMDSGDGNELVTGFWWYVTMVHDGTDDIIYLDGEEVNRKPAPGTLNSTARPFMMASNSVLGGFYFNGALDEIKVYNKALTADEIKKLYETGTTSVEYISPELGKYVEVLYPNPTTDQITLVHNFNTPQELWVRIFDQSGRQVGLQRVENVQLTSGKLTWDVSDYAPGYYTLNFILGGKNLGGMPFVKQ